MDTDKRQKVLTYIANLVSLFLKKTEAQTRQSSRRRFHFPYGSYLSIVYPIVKVMYISNVILQILILNKFLGTSYSLYGFSVIQKLVTGEEILNSYRFPRVTMCDFKIRIMGNVQRYTVQCALPINLYNEIIFTCIWFWFIFVAMATSCSFLFWVWRAIYRETQYHFVQIRLLAKDRIKEHQREKVKPFVKNYLQRDGVFLLRMVSRNSSDLVAAELVAMLWDLYTNKYESVLK